MSIYKKTKKIIGSVNYKNFKDKADMVDDLPITLNKKKMHPFINRKLSDS
jgi:hypothetical protein